MNQEIEQDFSQEIPSNFHENGVDSVLLDGFSVLKLPQLQSTTTAAAAASISEPAIKPLRKCTSCGSAKRRSPPPSHSSFYERSSKRAAISTNPSSPVPLPSPPSSAERKRDTLRRSLSDFPRSPVGAYQDFPTCSSLNPSSPSPNPGNSNKSLALYQSEDPIPMIPNPKPLHRSLSYPLTSDYDPAANTTPPRPPPVLRPQLFHQGSPNSKKLREVKEKVEELMQWMGQAGCDEQEDEDTHPNHVNKETQESVWVKQTEGGLILHFKCPCGEGYEVFLHGENCYYRLA